MTYLGLLEIAIRIPSADSLKAKRRIVRSLKDRIRSRFNVSLAETDGMDNRNRADLAAAVVAASTHQVDETLRHILRVVEGCPLVEVIESHIERF